MKMTLRPLPTAFAISLGIAVISGPAQAEIDGLHLTLTPYGGYSLWNNDTNFSDKPMAGGRLGLMFNGYVGIEGDYGFIFGETAEGSTPYPPSASGLEPKNADLQDLGAQIHLNLLPASVINPYLIAGYHWLKFKSDDDAQKELTLDGFAGGVGLKFNLGPRAALRFEAKDIMFDFKDAEGAPSGNDSRLDNFLFTGGIEFAIGGRSKDTDKDGVTDKKDECPATPLGALVDAKGCPLDGDRDGVFDGLDQCANTPTGARVDAQGCPTDQDKDGVYDGIDKCPDTPAGVKVDVTGCPVDSDKDGVPDGIDQCPNTPVGAEVDAAGCPIDSDKDGVLDGLDKCPNTAPNARVDVDGCPIEVSEKEIELLDTGKITVRNIKFETAKWDILPESQPPLDEIGNILIQWPDLRIEVGGHADSRGSDQFNLDLSDKRAKSVLDYLLQKFPQINPSQYTAKGYGETQPVASNANETGQAQNRRVEFKVLNTEVLKKESERRKTLQKD